MRILVTGGSGFIGKNLQGRIQNKYTILCPSSSELNLIDENSVNQYFQAHMFDIVIHCASWDATWNSRKDPVMILDHNLRMFYNLVRQKEYFNRLISMGSGAEFSKRDMIPQVTENFFNVHIPLEPYGFSKYIISKYIENVPDVINLRLFGVFGKYEDWKTRFISNVICRALYNLPLTIIQDLVFDYLYIEDLLDIIEWFINNNPKERVYNVCSGRTYYLSDLAKMVLEILGKDLPIEILREGNGIEYSGDNSRLRLEMENFKLTPMIGAIRNLILWYQENIDLVPYETIRENQRVKISLQENKNESNLSNLLM